MSGYEDQVISQRALEENIQPTREVAAYQALAILWYAGMAHSSYLSPIARRIVPCSIAGAEERDSMGQAMLVADSLKAVQWETLQEECPR